MYHVSVESLFENSDGDAHEVDEHCVGRHLCDLHDQRERLRPQAPRSLLELGARRPVSGAVEHLHIDAVVRVGPER